MHRPATVAIGTPRKFRREPVQAVAPPANGGTPETSASTASVLKWRGLIS